MVPYQSSTWDFFLRCLFHLLFHVETKASNMQHTVHKRNSMKTNSFWTIFIHFHMEGRNIYFISYYMRKRVLSLIKKIRSFSCCWPTNYGSRVFFHILNSYFFCSGSIQRKRKKNIRMPGFCMDRWMDDWVNGWREKKSVVDWDTVVVHLWLILVWSCT